MRLAIKEVIDMSWPTIVIVCSLLSILRVTYVVGSDRRVFCLHKELLNLLFIIYLLVLFQLVTKHDMSYGGVNLVPFQEILRYKFGSNEFFRQVFGNILLFVPFGYFATLYCRISKFSSIFFVSFLSSSTIEFVQRFIGRSFDVDDIILNVMGGIVGFLICISINAIKNHLPKFFQRDWFYNLLSLLLIVIAGFYLTKIL